jgi:ABC-type multidrug transport system permease subunit
MSVVHALRTSGVTVCATIHSPTATAFGLFDALMMLVRGRVVYFGSAGRQAVDYAIASWSTGGKGLDPGASSAEFLVDLITAADRDGRAAAFADIYARSPLAAASAAALDMLTSPGRRAKLPKHLAAELAVDHETVTPVWWGLKTLIKYRTPRNYRDPEFLGPRIGEPLSVVTLMWSLYWGVGGRFDGENYVNQAALLYFWVVLPAYGAASYVPAIVLERTLYTRERADGLYLPITYLLAKMIEELLLATSVSVINAAAGFHAIGFAGSFGIFWLVYAQCLGIGIVLAYWIAAASPNMDAANALLPAYVTVQLFFAGFILDFRTMPGYWKWYSYLDFMRYAWGALSACSVMAARLRALTCVLPAVVNQYSGEQGDPVWMNNRTVLEHYQLKNYKDSASVQYTWYKPTVEIGPNVIFLFMFFLGYFMLAWLTLKYKVYSQR